MESTQGQGQRTPSNILLRQPSPSILHLRRLLAEKDRKRILPSYLPNVETLIESLNTQFPTGLPTGARLFSIDAVAMYSNIDTEHGLQVCRDFFNKYKDQIPSDAPTEFLLEALEIIMKENYFPIW